MSCSITLTQVSWSTPEGRLLFSNLNARFGACRTGLVGRNGVGKTTLLQLIAGELAPASGQVAVRGRVGYLRQRVGVGPEETVADLFGVAEPLALLRRAEAGEAQDAELAEVDWSLEARVLAALGGIGLEARPETRLSRLSGGQRTLACLAAANFTVPDALLLDEPTNHLDREGRRAVCRFLAQWRAGAIVVSHDRELLETVDEIVELTPLALSRYGGNWSAYRERKGAELAALRHDLAHAEKRVAEVSRSVQTASERKARKDGAGRRNSLKGGAPRIGLGLRKDRSEATGGTQARVAGRRGQEAQAALSAARERLEVIEPFSVILPPTGLPAGKTVLEVAALSGGYTPGQPLVEGLSFTLTGPERVAITGPNGCGKSTLLKLIAGQLRPWSGSVRLGTRAALLDQQVELLVPSASIRENFLRLNPGSNENACRAALARFGFRADAALQTAGTLSGGQLLRAGLVCALGGAAPLPFLMLDEPTNHLDFDAIEAVEAGLRAYDGALLVVSHDEPFLKAIGITRRIPLGHGPSAGTQKRRTG